MHRKGHLGAALLAVAPLVAVLTAVDAPGLALVGCAVVASLSMLPDLDMRLPGVAHRGPTHTVRFALAVGAVLGLAGALLGSPGGVLAAAALGTFGFALGVVAVGSHIAADALTPMGVEPFADGRNISYDVARAANPIANYLLLGGGVVAVALGFGVGAVLAGLG